MTKRLTEVAKKAGVSEATVSRVLNGRDGVSEATRTAVLTALDVLGYERPTKLRGERARLVGLVLPELQNPIFPALAEVVTGDARPARLHPGALCPDHRRGLRDGLRGDAARPPGLRGDLRRWLVRARRRRTRPLPSADRPRASGRAGQRRCGRAGFPPGLHRRRGGGGAGVRAPALARARTDRHGARPGGPCAVPTQARRDDEGRGLGRGRRRVRRAFQLLDGGCAGRRDEAGRAGRDRHHLRQRRARAGHDPGGPPAGPFGVRPTCRWWVSTTPPS